MDKNLKDAINKMMKNQPIDKSFKEFAAQAKKHMKDSEKEKRPEVIDMLRIDRLHMLLEQQLRHTTNGEFDEDYEKTIILALEISKLIDYMTKETLREDGA